MRCRVYDSNFAHVYFAHFSSWKLCNGRGGEIIDGLMKVVGIKHKRFGGKISHTQLVRVNLVDSENPFFCNVWHGTHILDGSSPLLTRAAREEIQANGGRWPDIWFHQVEKIRRKLDFQHLVSTIRRCGCP